MTGNPTVSIVLPFFNEQRFLAEAVDSVLAQTFRDWELFLVDDGSSDSSSEIARGYASRVPDRIRYLEHPGHANHGRSAARNLGIQDATGEFISFIDADDRWTSTKLEHQVDLLRQNPRAGLATGRMTYWFSWTGRPEDADRDFVQPFDVPLDAVLEPPRMLTAYLKNEWSTLADILVRRSVIERVGGYEPAFRGMYDDQVFHAKLCLEHPIVTTSRSGYIYRQHDKSCVATADSHARTDGRRRFILWLGAYLDAHPVSGPDLLAVVGPELFPLRHPRLARLAKPYWSLRGRFSIQHSRELLSTFRRPRPLGRIRRWQQYRRKRGASCALVLMYHRVGPVDADPWQLIVTPERFAEHLSVLRRHTTPLPLDTVAEQHAQNGIRDRSVAVTFDDGYVDNLLAAKPLLEHADVPATVFVATGQTGGTREFWWDELERAILLPDLLPATLRLAVIDPVHQWALGEARVGAWNTPRGTKPSPARMNFYYDVWARLRVMETGRRLEALDAILEWSGAEKTVRASHRTMTADELVTLESGGLVKVGAHTVTHPFLPALSASAQRDEMLASRVTLESVLAHPIPSFSYPFGGATPETIDVARGLGFDYATGAAEETLWHGSDRFLLPRFAVRNWTGDEFEERLTRWFTQHVAPNEIS